MVARSTPTLTSEEYLGLDREADRKSEYRCGVMRAMAGASREHNELHASLMREIGAALKGRTCRPYGSDMRVRLGATAYVYPDIVIVCEEPRFTDERGDVLLNPTAVIEILSPSTESIDRGTKFDDYRETESIQEIVFVAQDRMRVERYERQGSNLWLNEILGGPDATLRLSSAAITVALRDIYDRVDVG